MKKCFTTNTESGDFMPKQVVFIMVDTQRQDMLSCYNSKSVQTPNLDSLAQEGCRFDNAYTCQPVCGPARSAIFTGLFPHSNGMVANSMQLGQNVKTVGEWLTPQGITCGYIGKWHLDGGDYFGYGKCPKGYVPEYWYDMCCYLEELSEKERKKSRANMNMRADDPKEETTYAHRCANRAIHFLRTYQNKDFFLTLSLDEPHDPSICPRRFFKTLKKQRFKIQKTPNINASLKNKPAHQKVMAEKYKGLRLYMIRRGMRALYACNAFCDYEIGRVLDEIKALGLTPMVIYTSDHGDMMLSHGLMGKGAVMYNEITQIPLLISGGGFSQGSNKTPVSHIDLLPTIFEFYGLKTPKMMQGEALQGLPQDKTRDVFTEFTRYEVDHDGFMGYQPIRSICNGKYKLVINLMTTDEFYDEQNDPYEKNNLIATKDAQLQAIRNAMHDRLLEQMNRTRDVNRGYYWAMRPWRNDKKATFDDAGFTRQLEEEDFVQLDYATGLPMEGSTRKK